MQTSNERDIQRYKNCIQKDDPLLVQDAVICKKMQKSGRYATRYTSTKHIKWKLKHGKKISASICSVFELIKTWITKTWFCSFATGHLSRPESTLGGRIVTEEGRRVLFASVYGQDLSSSWKGEDGHDWNMIMSATALKREDTYIHTYVRVTRHGKPHKRRNSGTPLSRCSPSQGVWPGLYYAGMHPDGKQGGIYVGNTVG